MSEPPASLVASPAAFGHPKEVCRATLTPTLTLSHMAHPGVPDEHLKILDDWFDKLTKKYPTVGRVT